MTLKKIFIGLITFVFSFIIPTKAQNIQHISKIVASDRDTNDNFGFVVSMSGNYAIVGAVVESEDSIGGNTLSRAGSAYIYENDGNDNWIEVQKIVPSDRDKFDDFGYDVSISSDYAIVGAQTEKEDATGGNTLSQAGSVYIFKRDASGHWKEDQKIVASDRAAGDLFSKVAISGSYAVVGARWEDEDVNGNNTLSRAGSAYIFEKDGNGIWNEVQKIVASDRDTTNEFGYSVSISGNHIVIGSVWNRLDTAGGNWLERSGAAYIFERDANGTWNEVQKITGSDRAGWDNFGFAVSVDGDDVIVGSFNNTDASGANSLGGAGAAYIYERNSNGKWIEIQKVVASDREQRSYFGRSVSISGDHAVVGAYGNAKDLLGADSMYLAGAAYLFKRDATGQWSDAHKFIAKYRFTKDEFGWTSSVDGENIIVGSFQGSKDGSGGNAMEGTGSIDVYKIIDNSIGIIRDENNPSIKVYPNPTNGTVTIDLGGQNPYTTITLRNVMGQIITNRNLGNKTVYDIEIEGNPGLYLLEVRTNDVRSAVFRIMKE